METVKKVWTKDEIKSLLEKNDLFVAKSVVKIWERQTTSEKTSQSTEVNNGIGFNGLDAKIMSSFAEYFVTHGRLSAKQLNLARKKIMKYAKQLTSIANA